MQQSNGSDDNSSEYDLSTEAVERFHTTGYLGPFRVCSEEQMEEYRSRVETAIERDGPHGDPHMYRHLDSAAVYQLCSHPAVVGRLQAVLGENLLLWASTLFNKRPGGDGIPWHQDTAYFDVEPPVTVTAWIALTEATVDNGCLQMIPGTHREHVPHIESESNSHFDLVAEPEYVPEKRALDIELSPGEAVLFNERVLHRSHPNTASAPRLGLSARVTVPFARINTDDPKILMTGTDEFGLNQLTEPPADSGSLD